MVRYLGIGVSEQYRVDQVTIGLRMVSVQSGEILLLNVNVTKTMVKSLVKVVMYSHF